jgi:hypothetical protein
VVDIATSDGRGPGGSGAARRNPPRRPAQGRPSRGARRATRGHGFGIWGPLRRASKALVWILVVVVGGSMIAYFALAFR